MTINNEQAFIFDRLPPQNLEAEEAILGGILLDPLAIVRICDILFAPEIFSLRAHQKIYQVQKDLYAQGKSTDLMHVAIALDERNWLESVGGQSKLAHLVASTVSAVNIDQYAELIKEKWIKRQIISACSKCLDEAFKPVSSPKDCLDLLGGHLQQIRTILTPIGGIEPITEIIPRVFEEISRAFNGEDEAFIETGFYDLDEIGGIPIGAPTTVAAMTGMGKTTVASNIAYNVASKGGTVAMFSLEMSKSQITRKILSLASGIDADKIFHPNSLTEKEIGELSNVSASLKLPLWFDDKASPSIIDIRSELRIVQENCPPDKPLKLVIVDYVELMKTMGANRDNRAYELGDIMKGLREIAKEFNVGLVVLAQIKRDVEKQADKRPTTADLRGSGGIAQESAKIILLYNDAAYNPNSPDKGVVELIIAKNRFGKSGKTIKLGFRPEIGKFYNLANL